MTDEAARLTPDLDKLIGKYGAAERALERNLTAERPKFQEKLDARDVARTALEAAIATSDKRADAFAYAVWMVGNMDTAHDKAAWWSDFQQVWDMAAERVQAMSDRGVKVGQGFAATGLMGVELDATPTPTVGGSKE